MKIGTRHNRGGGFTLVEMMLTVALVALIYTLISTILIQIARYVKTGSVVARQRVKLLRSVEEIRYQLRSLYYPSAQVGLMGKRTSTDGRDSLVFSTTNGRTHRGVVEACYQIQEYTDAEDPKKNGLALYYREFPFRRRELRTLEPHNEAAWEPYLKNVDIFECEYSVGGGVWQREWEAVQPPQRVRVRIERSGENHDRIVFDVTPGIGAARW